MRLCAARAADHETRHAQSQATQLTNQPKNIQLSRSTQGMHRKHCRSQTKCVCAPP